MSANGVEGSWRNRNISAPDAGHVEVRDLHDLGERVDARRARGAQLLPRHRAQRPHEFHDGLAVEPVRPHEDAVQLLRAQQGPITQLIWVTCGFGPSSGDNVAAWRLVLLHMIEAEARR